MLNENIAKKEVNGVNVTVRIDNVTGAAKYAMEFNVDVTDAVSTVSVKVDITAAITITLKNKAIKGPVADVLRAGQVSLFEYLTGTAEETLTLQPGESQYIYDKR